jgi:hypothetical protein
MIIHSNFQIVREREKRFDVLLHKPMLSRTEAEHFAVYYLLKNIDFTCYMLFGVRLLPYQEVILRAMLKKPYLLNLVSRGGAKTFLNGVYCPLRSIITPGSKILGVGANRRQSRFIYNVVTSFYNNKKAVLFREVAKKPVDQPEESYIEVCGAELTSRMSFTPIANGDRIRGFRASNLIVDEANIMSQEIYDTILQPMIAVALDPVSKVLQAKKEKELIDAGIITEDDAVEFESNQIILSSSAGYHFSFLYKKYTEYKDIILNNKGATTKKQISTVNKYGIIQLSYEAIEIMSPGYLNIDSINLAKKTLSSDRFLTEYCAQFASDSTGYIPRSLLETRQLKIGQEPTVSLARTDDHVYILAIDPSTGETIQNDWFGLVVIKVNVVTRVSYLINAYASTGKGWPFYIKLVREYIKNFNPEFIIADSFGGGTQMASLLCSSEYTNEKDGEKILSRIDKDDIFTYCHADNKILRMNTPTNHWNESANNNLKSMLEHEKFWFTSPINENVYKSSSSEKIDKLESISDSIEEVKNQIALIIGKQGANGLTTFEMPESLGKIRKRERMRKDLYSATLLGAWGIKEYFDILDHKTVKTVKIYNPVILTT